MNVGTVLCEIKSFLNIQVLFNKNSLEKLPSPIFTWRVKMGWGATNGNSRIFI
jgi:hypothetical protein